MSCSAVLDLSAPGEAEIILNSSVGVMKIYRRAEDISEAAWQRTLTAHRKDFRYYTALDETMSAQFVHRYLVLENHEGEVQFIQPLFVVSQDVGGELPALLQPWVRWLRKMWPRFLLPKMLMTGSSVGEGAHPCLKIWREHSTLLCAALGRYARAQGCSLIILKDIVAGYRRELDSLLAGSFARIPSFPGVTLPLDFETFEEYLNKHVGKETRRDIRRKLKKSAQLASLQFEVVADITPFADRIHELYLAVAGRSTVQFDVLTKDYFRAVGQRLPDRTRFFLWRWEGRIVAFSFCMIDGDTIYDQDIGLDYSVALDLHLYFVTRRDTFQWAVANGFKHYFCSPFGYEPKLRMGFKLVPFDLYVRHTNRLAQFFLRHLAPRLAPPKSEPLLSQFPNYSDLW